jgi:hypothetical protein
MITFAVTYEIITEASTEDGEAEETGFISRDADLRSALRLVQETDSAHCSQTGIEASDSDPTAARWFTVYNSADYITGAYENRALHLPENTTASSRRRVARLLGI